ncbi:hypothetical protein GJAV_G00268610, partial [Gymnothorax javanicus]
KISKIWASRVKLTRAKWQGPSDYSVICSDHFNDSDFEDEGFWSEFAMKKRRKIKPDAIPKIKSPFEGKSTEEKGRKKSRPGTEKRKKMKMLEEMLKKHEESQTATFKEEEMEQEKCREMAMEPGDSPASLDIDQPGPSWKSAEIPSAPVMDTAVENPRTTTRSVGTQTPKVATRVKYVQTTVRVHEKGVSTLPPVCISRGIMTTNLPKEEQEESPSSSSCSPSSPEAPQSPEYTPSSDTSDDDYISPRKAPKKKTGPKDKTPFPKLDIPLHEDNKYIVFESQLLELLKNCRICGSGDVELTKKVRGTHLKVESECKTCNSLFTY